MGLLAWSTYSPEAGDLLELLRVERLVLVVVAGPHGNGVAVAGAGESALPDAPKDLEHLAAFVAGALHRSGLAAGILALEFTGVQAIPPEGHIADTPTNLAASLREDLDAQLVALTWRDPAGRGYQVSAAEPEILVELPVHLGNVVAMARSRAANQGN